MAKSKSEDHDHPVAKRLFAPGKKRILALDGGGVRGVVTIAFLKEMERQLRAATGRNDLVLADVFDLIAGTSVGSMIATMLAMGFETKRVEFEFLALAPKVFTGRPSLLGPKRYNASALTNGVRSIVKDLRLGSVELKTGLVIIAKRVDKGSVWAFSNNPRLRFYEDGSTWDGNKHYKLEHLIRASTAVPFLFTPAKFTIHTDRSGQVVDGWFVDGAISPHNNPAIQSLLMAVLPSYQLGWKLSQEDLMMISVGTGLHRTVIDPRQRSIKSKVLGFVGKQNREDIEAAAFATRTLEGVIADNTLFALKLLQSLSHPRFSWTINTEINALHGETLFGLISAEHHLAPHGLLRFQRYDLPLERGGLVPPEFDVSAAQDDLMKLHAIDDPSIIVPLSQLATQVAKKQVSMQDFAGFL